MEKIKQSYAKYTWIPESVIQQAIEQKWERTLSIFIILRKTYKKPKFYKLTYRSLSEKTKLSTSTLQRHVKKLIQLGLATIHNGNLCLIGSDKLRKSLESPLIAVKYDKDRKNQILNIQFTRLLKNFRQQHYIRQLKINTIKLQEDTKHLSTDEAKKIIKKRNKYLPTTERLENFYSISNKGLANLVNRRSITTGNRLQTKLNAIGMIKSERNIEIVYKDKLNLRAFYELNFPCNCYLGKDGLVRKRKPNKITVLCK